MVEELLPASISLMSEVDMDKWVVPGLLWFLNKCQAGLSGSSAAFFDVAVRAGTNDVRPDGLSAHISWYDVVERQFRSRELFSAVLTVVFVTGEDISAIELYIISRQPVVEQESNDSRHGNMEIDG